MVIDVPTMWTETRRVIQFFVLASFVCQNNAVMSEQICGQGTRCMTLTDCPLVRDLMEKTCLAPDKLRELTCGYQGTEPMVCCPRGGEYSSVPYVPQTGYFHPQPSYQESFTTTTTVKYDAIVTESPKFGININCGQSLVRDASEKLGSHPWVVRVGFLNIKSRKINYACSGSIIAPNVILTSAHCVNASSKENYLSSVRVGEFDTKTDPDCSSSFCGNPVQSYQIQKAVIHPGYDAKTYKDNIALIILNKTIPYSVTAQPVCILQNGQVPLVNRRGFLIGWGRVVNAQNQEVQSTEQQQVDLPVVPLDECARAYQQKVPITKEQLCIGGGTNSDACEGFSGAPFVLLEHHSFSRYYLVGMMSFGSDKCGKDQVPSVYTSIHHYADWIRDNKD